MTARATDARSTVSAHWLAGLTALLALFYVFLGATALGLAGVLGILGGIVILATLAASGRVSNPIRVLLLCAAALPFAVLAWWSVIAPLLAVLVIAIGALAVTRSAEAGAARSVEP